MGFEPTVAGRVVRRVAGVVRAGMLVVMARLDDQPDIDLEVLRRVGTGAGLAAVGVTGAGVLEPARSVLPRRRAAGRAATMQFTYRNPTRSTDPGQVLVGAVSVVVGVLDYRRSEPDRPDGPVGRVARYSWRDHYADLAHGLRAMAAAIESAGWRARVVYDSNALVDRNAAWRAGLGWYGKNTNLLIRGAGSWFVLGAVVTDARIETTGPPEPDGCGPCTACLDRCPTGALVAPGVLDARRCIAWLVQAAEPIPVEFRAHVGDRIYGCDTCQEVCPENRGVDRREPPSDHGDVPDAWVDVRWILEADDEMLLARYGRWYLANRDPDVIRRTALVVLGNSGLPGSTGSPDSTGHAGIADLLVRYLAHPNPLLRSHALWAARRLGLERLTGHLACDHDPMVRAEWSTDASGPFW